MLTVDSPLSDQGISSIWGGMGPGERADKSCEGKHSLSHVSPSLDTCGHLDPWRNSDLIPRSLDIAPLVGLDTYVNTLDPGQVFIYHLTPGQPSYYMRMDYSLLLQWNSTIKV